MQPYRTPAGNSNPDVAPTVPNLRRSYRQRARMFGRANPSFTNGKGMKRRHRRECDTRDGGALRVGILDGRRSFRGADGQRYAWRELVHAPLDGRPAFLLGLRAHARRLMDQLTTHGPASGWGIAQPVEGAERNAKWTPYVVPKKSEKCWRWWRARRKDLARTLNALAYWWGKAVPLHRTASNQEPPGRHEETVPSCSPENPTRYRDRSAQPWMGAANRLAARLGM